jgi:hypothetical protein
MPRCSNRAARIIAICGARQHVALLSLVRLALLVLMATFRFSSCELVQFTSLEGIRASIDWSEAGADFEPLISSACAGNAAAPAGCASDLLPAFLAADLKLWNAMDGRNLTWHERPVRLMPQHLVDQFTMGGRVQHLKFYRSDSWSPSYEYGSDDIAILIDKARARVPGKAYPNVDRHIYACKASPLSPTLSPPPFTSRSLQWQTRASSPPCSAPASSCSAPASLGAAAAVANVHFCNILSGTKAWRLLWELPTLQQWTISPCASATTGTALASKRFWLTTRSCSRCGAASMSP